MAPRAEQVQPLFPQEQPPGVVRRTQTRSAVKDWLTQLAPVALPQDAVLHRAQELVDDPNMHDVVAHNLKYSPGYRAPRERFIADYEGPLIEAHYTPQADIAAAEKEAAIAAAGVLREVVAEVRQETDRSRLRGRDKGMLPHPSRLR